MIYDKPYVDNFRKRMLSQGSKILTDDELLEFNRVYYSGNFSLYDIQCGEFSKRGIKLASRTGIECLIDVHAKGIVDNVKKFMNDYAVTKLAVVDLFLGSGNLLY